MITDYKAWLKEDPDKEDVFYLDEEKTIAYIPIARIETKLDLFDSWSADFFTFNIFRAGNYWFASGHILLTVEYFQDGKHYLIKRPGAATIPVGSTDLNMDYEATLLSLALANSVKKLGAKFGRHLNNRMNNGETSYRYKAVEPVEQTAEEKRAAILIEGATTAQELSMYKKTIPKSMMPVFMAKLNSFKK